MRRLDRGRTAGTRGERRRPLPRWAVAGLGVGAFLAALAGPAWLWRSGVIAVFAGKAETAAVAASADLGLRIREVLLVGRDRTPRRAILEAAALEIGEPILGFEPERVRERIERIDWVAHARVSRRLSGTVVIEIDERRPLALWQRDGRLALIDEGGRVITERDLYRFAGLPLVVGPDAPGAAHGLLSMLAAEPDLAARVRAAVRVGGRRWDVRLDNGIDVRLPELDAAAAWHRVAELDRHDALLARAISAIDLRIPGRVVVTRRTPDTAGPTAGGSGRG